MMQGSIYAECPKCREKEGADLYDKEKIKSNFDRMSLRISL